MEVIIDAATIFRGFYSNYYRTGIYRCSLSLIESFFNKQIFPNLWFPPSLLKPEAASTLQEILQDYHEGFTSYWISSLNQIDSFLSQLNSQQSFIYHNLTHSIPSTLALRQHSHCKHLVTIHDLTPFHYMEYWSPNSLAKILRFLHSLNEQDWVICPSLFTKMEILKYLKIPENQIHVIPFAINHNLFFPIHNLERLKQIEPQLTDHPYLMYVGRLEDRKNVALILKTFKELALSKHIPNIKLVLCGKFTATKHEIETCLHTDIYRYGLEKHIFHFPDLNDEDLNILYNHAFTFLFLSDYEGFGLPPLEAMKCRTPVIGSKKGSLPEVLGNAYLAVDSEVSSVVKSILDLYSNNAVYQYYQDLGEKQTANYHFDKTAQKTFDIYKAMLSS